MAENVLENAEMDLGRDNSVVKTRVLRKVWDYLDQNFHKLTEQNKIKVALAIATKDMPEKVEGNASETKLVIIRSENKQTNSVVEHKIAGGREISFD